MGSDDDILTSLFVQEGMKQGLDETLLKEVLALLVRVQFIPQGKRSNVQADVQSMDEGSEKARRWFGLDW